MASNKKKEFKGLQKSGSVYRALEGDETMIKKLEPGMYDFIVQETMVGNNYLFKEMEQKHDRLVELESPAFTNTVKEITAFLKPEVKQRFAAEGFIYKRGIMLYGLPGTGKTCIVHRLVHDAIARGSVVLFNPNPNHLEIAFSILDSLQPDTLVTVIFEEFDKAANKYEVSLLSLLDGEVQKQNVLYIATTNYIDKVPTRLLRPGRFATTVEVVYPTAKERTQFLESKLTTNRHLIPKIVKKTEGFSIDEVKEVILTVVCLGQELDDVVGKINRLKKSVSNGVWGGLSNMLGLSNGKGAYEPVPITRIDFQALYDDPES